MAGNGRSAARRRIEQLAAKSNGTPMKLAGALAALGSEAPEIVEGVAKGKRISRRALFYHLKIGRMLSHLGVPPSRLAAIGWTKLAIIAQHFKDYEEGEERDALVLQALSDAEHYTAKELPAILNGEPPKAKVHSIHLRLTPRQYGVFAAAMSKYGAKPMKRGRGFADKEKALTKALRALAGSD